MIKLVPAKCPSCGADIEVNKKLENTICQYCGTTVLVDDAIAKLKVELSGKVEVDGISGDKDKLAKARKYIKLKEYDNAKAIIDKIIAGDKLNEEAYFERLLLNLDMLDNYNFDGKTNRYNDSLHWNRMDTIFNTLDRIKKIDDDDHTLKEDLDSISDRIEKYKKIKENVDKSKKDLDYIREGINQRLKDYPYCKSDLLIIIKDCFEIDSDISKVFSFSAMYGNGLITYSDDCLMVSAEIDDVSIEKMKQVGDECLEKMDLCIKAAEFNRECGGTGTVVFAVIYIISFLALIIRIGNYVSNLAWLLIFLVGFIIALLIWIPIFKYVFKQK